jgi:hypothetical protein
MAKRQESNCLKVVKECIVFSAIFIDNYVVFVLNLKCAPVGLRGCTVPSGLICDMSFVDKSGEYLR